MTNLNLRNARISTTVRGTLERVEIRVHGQDRMEAALAGCEHEGSGFKVSLSGDGAWPA